MLEAVEGRHCRKFRRPHEARFERVLGLPTPIDANPVRAELVNGVLRVALPVAETARARRIQIAGPSEPSRPALTGGTEIKR